MVFTTEIATAQQRWNPGFSIGTASGQYDFSPAQAPCELSGTLMRAGPVGANDFGPGNTGITQYQLMEKIPMTSFETPVPMVIPAPEYTPIEMPEYTPIDPAEFTPIETPIP